MPLNAHVLLFLLPVLALAPAPRPRPWIGTNVDPLRTAFCAAYRCTFEGAEKNTPHTQGWNDGERRRYRLGNGAVFEVEVRPAGWISNVRLGYPLKALPTVDAILTRSDIELEAAFLSAATGRGFRPGALRRCHDEATRLYRQNADVTTPPEPLSRWSTPLGRAFVARCGVGFSVSVWAGWRQQ